MKTRLHLAFTLLVAACMVWPSTRLWAHGGAPLLTEDTGTPGDGRWETNLALTLDQRRAERSYGLPSLDVNYGLGERMQLNYSVQWTALDKDGEGAQSGLSNSVAAVKWRFLDEGPHPIAMSVYPQLEFRNPTSSRERGLADDSTTFTLPLQVEKTLGPVIVNTELGYGFRSRNTPDEWVYGVSLGHEVVKDVELLGEVYGTSNRSFQKHELVFNVGTRWKLTDNLALHASVGRSSGHSPKDQPELLAYLGLQVKFGGKKDK